MFKKLFGGSSANDKAKGQQMAPVDSTQTIDKLGAQIENVDKRAKVLENRVRDLKNEALAKKKAKDQRGNLVLIKLYDSYIVNPVRSYFFLYRSSPRLETEQNVRKRISQNRWNEDITYSTEVHDRK